MIDNENGAPTQQPSVESLLAHAKAKPGNERLIGKPRPHAQPVDLGGFVVPQPPPAQMVARHASPIALPAAPQAEPTALASGKSVRLEFGSAMTLTLPCEDFTYTPGDTSLVIVFDKQPMVWFGDMIPFPDTYIQAGEHTFKLNREVSARFVKVKGAHVCLLPVVLVSEKDEIAPSPVPTFEAYIPKAGISAGVMTSIDNEPPDEVVYEDEEPTQPQLAAANTPNVLDNFFSRFANNNQVV